MRRENVLAFADYMYWVNHRLLDAAAGARAAAWAVDAPAVTTRNLRATLVHELDVEWSWRLRLQGATSPDWGEEGELRPEEFPDVAALRARWNEDESEMRAWIESLTDADLATPAPNGGTAGETAPPLWQFLMHVFTHAMQQQADAATLLTLAGASPGQLEFLEYVDATLR